MRRLETLDPLKRSTKDYPLYNSYFAMKSRCYNPKNIYYKYYGAKGIKICGEWQTFSQFEKWAYEHGYEEGLTLERIDNTLDYSPDNCRWATRQEQAENRPGFVYDINGLNLKQYCKEAGLNYNTVRQNPTRYIPNLSKGGH